MLRPVPSACLAIAIACASCAPATAAAPAATEARADSLFRAGRFDAARAGYEAALAERSGGADSSAIATLWLKLADTHGRLAQFAQAVTLGERALAFRERRPIADSVALATALNNLALSVDAADDAPRARALLERSLDIERRSLGPDHAYALSTTHNLALVMEHMADYRPAGEMAERAATAWARQLLPELQSPAAALGLLSRLQSGEAERMIVERARTIWEMARGPGRVQVEAALTAGGAVTHAGGSYFWWAQLVRHLRPFAEQIFGPDHPDMIYVLTMLADMQEGAGEFADSKRTLEQALDLAERSFGPVHPTVSMVCGTLGWLAYESGDYPQARSYFERAIDIDQRLYGPSGSHGWFNDLGLVLEELGDEPRAEALYREALGDMASGPPDLYQAHLLNNLGRIEMRRGERATAGARFERSLAIMETMPFPDHPRVAPVLVNLATIEAAEGRLDSARVLLRRALDVTRGMNGPLHPDVAWALLELARVDARAGRPDSAFAEALRAEAIAREHQRVTIRGVSEREALRYAAARPPALDFAASVAAAAATGDPARTRALWDAVIRGRALVLDEMAARHRAAISTRDSATAAAVERVTAARERLANLVVRGLRATPVGPSSASPSLDAARRELDHAETELAERSGGFQSELALRRAGFAETSATLDSGSALVAYLEYESGGGGYLALVARPGGREPTLVPLGRADLVDSLAARWGAAVRSAERRPPWNRGRGDAAAEAGERLRRAVWDPLAPHLAGARRVFVVPDGALMLVSFGALPRGGRYLIEDPVVLHELSAERDLVALRDSAAANHGLLAMGGPDFDATEPLASRAGAVDPGDGLGFRSRSSSCDEIRRRRFEKLPQAAAEARWIASLWNETEARAEAAGRVGEPARALTGALATETRFKREAPGKRVLHIATHGFFVGDGCRGGASPATSAAAVWLEPDSPLLLSGLALAGANHRARDDAEQDDGILTAEEVGSLDLSGVDWAVLSACESGAGRVRPGEGVLGLRRAFEVAGVRTLIMSLWPVSDEWAKVWMSSLYRARLESGAGTAEAVRRASLEVLERRRREGLSTEPYYWAGFVATGDWR